MLTTDQIEQYEVEMKKIESQMLALSLELAHLSRTRLITSLEKALIFWERARHELRSQKRRKPRGIQGSSTECQ